MLAPMRRTRDCRVNPKRNHGIVHIVPSGWLDDKKMGSYKTRQAKNPKVASPQGLTKIDAETPQPSHLKTFNVTVLFLDTGR